MTIRLMSLKTAAREIGVAPKTLSRWIREGKASPSDEFKTERGHSFGRFFKVEDVAAMKLARIAGRETES